MAPFSAALTIACDRRSRLPSSACVSPA